MSASQSPKYKFVEEVDRLADLVGADRAADLIKTRLEQQTRPLDVSGETVPTDPTGVVADAEFANGDSLKSGESIEYDLEGLGAERLVGRVLRGKTAYTVKIKWTNEDGDLLFTDTVASSVGANTATSIDVLAESPYCTVVVSDAGSGAGKITHTLHLR